MGPLGKLHVQRLLARTAGEPFDSIRSKRLHGRTELTEEKRGEASRSSEMALSFGALSKVDLSYADLERVALETRTNATLARFRRSMMEDIVEAYSRVFGQR